MRLLFILAGLLPSSAIAQSVPPPEPPPICTDRPTNGNYACTVPKGMWQLEADAFGWTAQRIDGERTDVLLFSNPTLKYGLSDRSDVQLNWAPFIRARARDANGEVSIIEGVGDLSVRYKHRLTPSDANVEVALLPFIKLPTARRGIGNGRVEGGVALPINYHAPGDWTITLGPQIDILADADGLGGYHAGLTGLVNIAKSFGPFTILNELWTGQDFDPSGTVRQYSYDVALVWLARPSLQLDIGANIGLNRETPGLFGYVGISTRF